MPKPRKTQGKVGQAKSEIVAEVPLACADEAAALEFMEARRWGDCPKCPHCESANVYVMKSREGVRNKDGRWRCRDCGRLYTVRTGTIMEESRIPLRHWCYAFWAACASKKGISAKQIQRQTGLSYKSALFLMHRIRFAMSPNPVPEGKLVGTIEADETFVGGRPRHKIPYIPGRKGYRSHKRKQPVFAALCRETGTVYARVVPNVTSRVLGSAISELVDKSSRLITDEAPHYIRIGKGFAKHDSIKHDAGVYAIGDITTNTIESFFAILKRGIYGTFHNVSRKHLGRYVDEFCYRYNTREMDDGERMEKAIRQGQGRRLAYREPVGRTS